MAEPAFKGRALNFQNGELEYMRIYLRIAALIVVCALLTGITPALAVQADTVTRQCAFKVERGSAKNLTDGDMDTAWEPSGSENRLLITLPENGAGYVVVEWAEEPTGYTFAQYDANQAVVSTMSSDGALSSLVQVFDLDSDARYALFTLTEGAQAICEIRVYSPGELPADIQRWQQQYTKCDMMLVAAYPGDEFVTFGGLLPYYALERDANVQVVYMTSASREQKAEALDAMWSMGMAYYPVFMDMSAGSADSLEDCLDRWGGKDALIGAMVEQIRRYQPDVIVSHAMDGEGGDYRRALTAMLMQYAIDAAADPEQHRDSSDVYGAWKVKKLYLHLEGGGAIDFDWNIGYDSLGGMSPLAAAQSAFAHYDSLSGDYAVTDGGEYDNSLYGLAFTAVGEDARHDDFFENITGLEMATPAPEAAEPTPSPTPTPAIVFSPEPTEAPRQQPGEADDFSSNALQVIKFVGIALGAILLLTCGQALIYHFRRRGRRR